MKVTDEQLLELFQLKIGDVIQSNDLKKYCDGIEFWKISKTSLVGDEVRVYPLYKNNTESPFNSGGMSLIMLAGLDFEKINDVKEIKFIKDMTYSECYDLYMWENEFEELKPFFILCDNLIAIPEDATMQDALNSLGEELHHTSTLIIQLFQELINKPYYDGNDDESNSK
ncbi:MAG: hypothetical protein IKT40_03210 [Bacilli bacterium]|nr:hypothetical protein [Bacilli bacterium]